MKFFSKTRPFILLPSLILSLTVWNINASMAAPLAPSSCNADIGYCCGDGGYCFPKDKPCPETNQEVPGDCSGAGGGKCCKPPASELPQAGAKADVTQGGTYGYQPPLGANVTIPQLVARIISQVLPLVGALFLAMFIWGGFQWMTATGDETKVKKARQTLLNAVIGIAIVMGAYVLVYNLIQALGKGLGQ